MNLLPSVTDLSELGAPLSCSASSRRTWMGSDFQ